jgi:hypothetical protein
VIYTLYINEVKPGKMAEYQKIMQEMAPINDRYGQKRVLAAQSYTGNVNELYHIFAFENLDEMQKMNEKTSKDKDLQRLQALCSAMRVRQTRLILEQLPGEIYLKKD